MSVNDQYPPLMCTALGSVSSVSATMTVLAAPFWSSLTTVLEEASLSRSEARVGLTRVLLGLSCRNTLGPRLGRRWSPARGEVT